MNKIGTNMSTVDVGKYVNIVSPLQTSNRTLKNTVVDIGLQGSNSSVADVSRVKVGFEEPVREKYAEIIQDEVKMDFITETLNQFMAQWNAELKFAIHKETGGVIVRFINADSNKIIKEFPPEEYLDMLVNIRKYILGTMVDEKI